IRVISLNALRFGLNLDSDNCFKTPTVTPNTYAEEQELIPVANLKSLQGLDALHTLDWTTVKQRWVELDEALQPPVPNVYCRPAYSRTRSNSFVGWLARHHSRKKAIDWRQICQAFRYIHR